MKPYSVARSLFLLAAMALLQAQWGWVPTAGAGTSGTAGGNTAAVGPHVAATTRVAPPHAGHMPGILHGRAGRSYFDAPAQGASNGKAMTVMAAGDIACDPTSSHFNAGQGDNQQCHEMATAKLLLAGHPDAILALGDDQYEQSTLAQYLASYDPSWGRLKSITHPVTGNHEYVTGDAAGYFDYFGDVAAPRHGGYYSFDVGDWHFIALNSNCWAVAGCDPGSPQDDWLLSDLASHRSACTVAYWHYPRFSSGTNGNYAEMQTFWDDLYAFGADIVLNGHDHGYERFAPQNPKQHADPTGGIREFVVGTGGRSHTKWLAIQPNSEVHDGNTYGVLRLSLHSDSYDWQFLPDTQSGNGTFTEQGSDTCHGLNAGTENGNGPRAVPVVSTVRPGTTISRFTVDFSSTKPGQGQVLFGPGPGCSGLVLTATRDTGTGTTRHAIVVAGNDLPGTVGDIGIQPGATYWFETETVTAHGTEIDNNGGKCYSVTIPSA